jgi:hypothetical protein
MALYRGAQALAAIRGRNNTILQDVVELAGSILWKRIAVTAENLLKGVTEETVIDDILHSTAEGLEVS